MNLVFPALAVFIFIYPGMVFRRTYKNALWKSNLWGDYPLGRLGPVAEQIPSAFGHAVWLNSLWLGLVVLAHLAAPRIIPAIHRGAVVAWFSNNFGKDQAGLEAATRALANFPGYVIAYFLGLFTFSFAVALLLRTLVRALHLDWKYSLFRFDNHWYYLFNGEVLRFRDPAYPGYSASANLDPADRVGTIVTAVVDFKDKTYLYQGVLVEPLYDSAGNLDRLVLEGAQRREITDDHEPGLKKAERFYEIRGHYFVLRNSEIKTINIDYLMASDLQDAEQMSEGVVDLEEALNEFEGEQWTTG